MTVFHFDRALTPAGWQENVELYVQNGHISAVTANVNPKAGAERHAIAIPGMPNLHSHAFQRAMSGLAETRGPSSDSFWSWREVMYRFALSMSPEDVAAVAAQAYAEMLEGGFTRVGEFHYMHHDKDGSPYSDIGEQANRIAEASVDTGIGLTLLPVFYAHSGFGRQAPNDGQRRFINSVESYEKLVQRCTAITRELAGANVGIAPHSLRAVTREELAAILPFAQNGPVHVHIAEQVKEVEDCIAFSGQRPVELLLDWVGNVDGFCLIHATHMTLGENLTLAKSGAVAGLCPITEASLGDGIFNGPAFYEAGGAYGIGSDSNVEINAFAELRQLEYSQRLALKSRNVMTSAGQSTGLRLFEDALQGGSKALGQAISGLTVGASADFVTLMAEHAAFAGHGPETTLDAAIFGGARDLIDSVWTRGMKRVEKGRHVESQNISATYRKTMNRLLSS